MSLLDQFDNLERWASRPGDPNQILRAPFGWPGGKSKSVMDIVPHLPNTRTYIEPFGGAGSVLLARGPSQFEVFNDRYSGVTAFYKVLQTPELYMKLIERLDLTIHSKEYWHWCKDSWKNPDDPVERAARWYIMVLYSFGAMGRNWARLRKVSVPLGNKMHKHLEMFPIIHERIKRVQIDNEDAFKLLRLHDSKETVFYLDPPYVGAYEGAYTYMMSTDRHMELLDIVFDLEGFVAVSGYDNRWYGERDWDNKIEFMKTVCLTPGGETENASRNLTQKRIKAKECLWIKEAG